MTVCYHFVMKKTLTSKILAASAVGVFALGTVACGSDTDDPADPVEEPADPAEEPAGGDDPAMEEDPAMEDDG